MAYSNEYTNYIAYRDPQFLNQSRIGHLNIEDGMIIPLGFLSGTPLTSLYEVIEVGEAGIKAAGEAIPMGAVKVLAPIGGRDVLCVGKNYGEHAKEFNSSGFDSSDKVDIPTHPVIFTKRATSIIANGEPILLHEEFTKSADYEGEIGVIVGKTGFRIREEDAMDYVWGYTIVNDMTARERQRDHKQFYLGKSPDTFCPMGPIAVPAHKLPKVLRVETVVNGEKRQNATTEGLIFSIPFLIKTLSEGQTLQPGDVLATGTPAGVGIGKKPPVYLKSGDAVEISVTGLSTLKNQVADAKAPNPTIARVSSESRSHIPIANLSKTLGGVGLTTINSKQLYYKAIGNPSGPPIIFLHGLGGTSEFFRPLIDSLKLQESYSLHLLDLEGFGLSPTSASSITSIDSFASDVVGLASLAKISSGAILVGHSMGCYIALSVAINHPCLVSKLILMGPPPTPMLPDVSKGILEAATAVRKGGMTSVVDLVLSTSVSEKTKRENHLAVTAVRLLLLGQDPEGYAKGCGALAGHVEGFDLGKVKAETLILTGDEDNVGSPVVCEKYADDIAGSKLVVLNACGHLQPFEDITGVAGAVKPFLSS